MVTGGTPDTPAMTGAEHYAAATALLQTADEFRREGAHDLAAQVASIARAHSIQAHAAATALAGVGPWMLADHHRAAVAEWERVLS